MFNKVFLLGRLGCDPEVDFVKSEFKMDQTTVVKFSLATSTFAKGKESTTEWHNIVAWNRIAENCAKYLKKGSQVLIEGRIKYESWETPQGIRRNITKIVAERVQFLSHPKSSGTTSETTSKNDFVDDIPF